MHRILPPVVLAVVFLARPAAVHAQASAAEALFDQGKVALAAGDLETACARFRASDQVEPAAGTRANLADCEERRGRVATAWELYKSALAKLPPDDSRVRVLKERIAKLEPRLPKVVLALSPGAPQETTVREGEATIGAATTFGVPLPLDPGVHHLVVSAPGRMPRTIDVTLAEGKVTSLLLNAAPNLEAPPVRGPDAPPVEGVPSRGPWVVGGVAIGLLIVGGVTGAVVLEKKSVANAHCTDGPPPTCRDQTGLDAANAVRTLGPVSTAGLVLGAAGVATGAIWLALRRPGKSTERVGVAPTYGGAVWSVERSW